MTKKHQRQRSHIAEPAPPEACPPYHVLAAMRIYEGPARGTVLTDEELDNDEAAAMRAADARAAAASGIEEAPAALPMSDAEVAPAPIAASPAGSGSSSSTSSSDSSDESEAS